MDFEEEACAIKHSVPTFIRSLLLRYLGFTIAIFVRDFPGHWEETLR